MEVYKVGDVVFGRLKQDGHIQGGERPMLIVSNDVGNQHSPVYTVIPFTTGHKRPLPTHVRMKAGTGGLKRDSILLAEQKQPINKEDVLYKMGTLDKESLAKAAWAMVIATPIVAIAFQDGVTESEEFQKVFA